MEVTWTLTELVDQATAAIAQLPPPTNGQIRAVPDERTIRYYATIGLLDRPSAMRGRTALYDRKHLAQVVAIKRLQTAGRSLAEIQAQWPTLNDHDLGRMAGIPLKGKARKEFWKQEPARTVAPRPRPAAAPIELRIELAPNCFVTVAVAGDAHLTAADASALRAAAAPLVAELARRGLTTQNQEDS